MENKFLSISRKFIFFMAGLSLAIAIISSLIALAKFTSSADETIKVPKVDSESYFKQQEKKEEIKSSKSKLESKVESSIENTKSKVDIEAEKSAKIVFDNLNQSTSKILGVENSNLFKIEVIENIFKDNFAKQIILISDEEHAIEFFKNISIDSANTVKNFQFFKDKDSNPGEYIDWYFQQYYKALKEENKRIEAERTQSILEKSEAVTFITITGIIFGVFIILTIILVLFKIEINTRKE